MLVVLESTTYPGTTDEIVRPLLEGRSGLRAGRDFALAFSPERIDPGNPDFGIRNTPKVVGGITSSCTEAAEIFYGKICDQVIKAASAREAEMAKLLENTYRHVNIALVNEMAIFSHELGVNLWDAIRCAATKPFGFQAFYPGPGVGGHCIPIDPNYLSHRVRALGYPFRFVELAQEINGRMPGYVVDRAVWLLNDQKKALNGALVLLAGVTYKKDSADLRETPAVPVARKLLRAGARLAYADPYVSEWQVDGQPIENSGLSADAVEAPDLVILLQAHNAFDLDSLASHAQVFLDTRGASQRRASSLTQAGSAVRRGSPGNGHPGAAGRPGRGCPGRVRPAPVPLNVVGEISSLVAPPAPSRAYGRDVGEVGMRERGVRIKMRNRNA